MANNSNNVVLVGPMGSGKTTVGRRLASEMKRQFFDTDHEIIDKTGVTIECIFDIEGEKGFRRRESKMLEDLCNMNNVVLATGGGIVLKPENRVLLKKSGLVFYLSSSIEQLVRRTAKSKTRPLLEQSLDREKTIRELVSDRDDLYREVASSVVDTTGKRLYEVVKIIKQEIESVA
ncbi:MAG TPA: shikimate kinase [Gammaproteobacteria bacterium]|jgi:shikimate kinase|nr:shikimate kinase [Gammaproteobacteria bacterium]